MARFGVNREFAECDRCGHPQMAHFGGGCYCGCARAAAAGQPVSRVAAEPDDLVATLHDEAAAAATRPHGDWWGLVAESARLRSLGRADEARATARTAQDVAATAAERAAATTMVVASLCDLWRDEEARREGESALAFDQTSYLLRALARAWFLGFAATGVEEFRSRAHDLFRRADELEAVAA